MQKQKISVIPCILIFADDAMKEAERRRKEIRDTLEKYGDRVKEVFINGQVFTLSELFVIFKKIDAADFLQRAAELKGISTSPDGKAQVSKFLAEIDECLNEMGCGIVVPRPALREWLASK